MLGYLDRIRATRSASAIISPLVERSRRRRRGLSPDIWRQPYVIGFISSLITLIAARVACRRLESNRLGSIQLACWTAVTGQPDDEIGEDICMLSANRDEAFMLGCHNAGVFLAAYCGEPLNSAEGFFETGFDDQQSRMQQSAAGEENLEIYGKGGIVACFLWQQFFDAQIH